MTGLKKYIETTDNKKRVSNFLKGLVGVDNRGRSGKTDLEGTIAQLVAMGLGTYAGIMGRKEGVYNKNTFNFAKAVNEAIKLLDLDVPTGVINGITSSRGYSGVINFVDKKGCSAFYIMGFRKPIIYLRENGGDWQCIRERNDDDSEVHFGHNTTWDFESDGEDIYNLNARAAFSINNLVPNTNYEVKIVCGFFSLDVDDINEMFEEYLGYNIFGDFKNCETIVSFTTPADPEPPTPPTPTSQISITDFTLRDKGNNTCEVSAVFSDPDNELQYYSESGIKVFVDNEQIQSGTQGSTPPYYYDMNIQENPASLFFSIELEDEGDYVIAISMEAEDHNTMNDSGSVHITH